jgi:aminoglycoside phosphotransferase (APT) family kinase protein
MRTPNEDDARQLAETLSQGRVARLERFATGMCHYVYDVEMDSGQQLVVRIADADHSHSFAGAVHWSQILRPMGAPLAEILSADIDGAITGYSALLLERLPGTDLGKVYANMTREQKFELAQEMIQIHKKMDTLPLGKGYGFTPSINGPWPHGTWAEVVEASVNRSRQRLQATGVEARDLPGRLLALLKSHGPLLAQVPARPFLDDSTTKNVIMSEGKLSGIVDVDEICYGDPLFNVALTHTALCAAGLDTDYTEHWLELLQPPAAGRQLFQLYRANFLLDFLSEIGQKFNRGIEQFADQQYQGLLHSLLNEQLTLLESQSIC